MFALTLAGLTACRSQPGMRPPATPAESVVPVVSVDATPPGPVGCLEGVALNEENEPVAGVKITVAAGSALAIGPTRGPLRPVDVSTITGPDGTFRLCDVPSGRNYVLIGEHADYTRSDAAGFTVEAEGITRGAVLWMSAGVSIRGVVSHDGGGPLPGARVELYLSLDLALQKREQQQPAEVAVANAEGRYEFRHVASHPVRLLAHANGFATQARAVGHALGTGDQECDFDLEPGAALTGRVEDADGRGVRGAHLLAKPVAEENLATLHAQSDEHGRFLFEDAGPEPYQLTGLAAGFTEQSFGPVDTLARDVVIVLARQASVSGVVTLFTGAPVDTFSLHLRRVGTSGFTSLLNRSQRYEAVGGRFNFAGIDPGDYVLEARADGAADTCSEPFTIEQGVPEPQPLTISMRRGGTLRGQVRDAHGRPLAGALVTLNSNNHVDSSIARLLKAIAPGDDHERSTSTVDDGSFSFAHVPEGLWQLVGEHADAASRVRNDVLVQDADAGPTVPVDLVLPPGAGITGQVVDDRGLPLPHTGLQICTVDNSFMDRGTTDAEGCFRLMNLRAGLYQISIQPERVRGKLIHPFIRLVIASKSRVDVHVAEGQVVDDVLIRMKDR